MNPTISGDSLSTHVVAVCFSDLMISKGEKETCSLELLRICCQGRTEHKTWIRYLGSETHLGDCGLIACRYVLQTCQFS
jgi:hypothetical protein